jgi:methylglutaconyl-CoA hydratase
VKQVFKTLSIKSEAPILQVHLNIPQKRNALNNTIILELTYLMKQASKNPKVKTVTISGEGSAFCSGADLEYLKELQNYSRKKNQKDINQLANLYRTIYEFPKPVVAAVNGPAIAGGCGLATVCDIIIASDKAYFGYPETTIGFVAAVVSFFLIRQIGERKAKELLLTGKILNAEEAYNIGLINQLVAHNDLYKVVLEFQNQLLKNSPQAMFQTKNLFNLFEFKRTSKMLSIFKNINIEARETSDFLEGISAFLEKRKPKWH